MCDGGCGGELGNENASFYVYLRDNINITENSTGCQTRDDDNCFTWDMPDVTLGPRTNASDYFILRMYGWEDDNGSRCSADSGDDCDCKNRDNINVDYTAGAFPSNDVYTTQTDWNWCSGSSGWAVRYRYTWKYTGTASPITITCTNQTVAHASGRVRSNSVYLTAGSTVQFETTSGPDTYLRLYAPDGYTIVAFNDDGGTNSFSLLTYTVPTSGWYYIENSQFSRNALSAASNMTYKIVEKTGASLTNYINAGAITCTPYSNTQNNSTNTGFCNYIGQGSDDIYYRFTTSQSGYIDLSHCASGFDTYMHLLNSAGTSLATADDNGPLCTGNKASLRYLLAAGTYFVVSEGYSSNSGDITTSIQAHTPTGGTISGTVIVCPSQSGVVYSIAGVSAATNYVWAVPSGASITSGQGTTSITVTFGSTGGNVTCIPKNYGDQCVGSTATFAITMQTNSTAPATISGTTTICNGGSTTLTASGGTSGTGASFEWFAGSCASTVIGTSASITVTPTTNTTYYVRRTGTCNTTGCLAQLVTVNTLSTIPTTISGTTTICNGGNTVLTVSGGTNGTGAVYEWFAGTCASTVIGTGASITVTPTGNTTYFVRRNGTCNSTNCISQLITVNTLSTAPTTISGTTTICNGGSTILTVSGGSDGTGASFQWFAGTCASTVIGTGSSITVSPTSNTTYLVRRTGTCNSTNCTSQLVTVNTLSTAPTTVSGTTTICNGDNTVLTASGGTDGTGAVFQWFSGSCGTTVIGTGASITVTPTSNITYYVRRLGSCNTTGCIPQLVTVNTQSTSPTVITGTTTICNGGSTILSVSGGSAGTGATFEWYAGACASSVIGTSTSITVSPTSNTTYFVRRSGTCNNTSCISQLVTVNTLSTAPTTISGNSTICIGNSTTLTASGGSIGTGATYQWFAGTCATTVIGTGASITVTPITSTMYFVRRTGTCNTSACTSLEVQVDSTNTWTGSAGSGGVGYWDIPANWSCGVVPTAQHKVVIPSAAPNQPTIRNKAIYGVALCKSINIASGANLTMSATGELRIDD